MKYDLLFCRCIFPRSVIPFTNIPDVQTGLHTSFSHKVITDNYCFVIMRACLRALWESRDILRARMRRVGVTRNSEGMHALWESEEIVRYACTVGVRRNAEGTHALWES